MGNRRLYTTKEEEEKFRNSPEVLEQIDMERALSHDGISDNGPLYSDGGRNDYLYTTKEEEEKFRSSPEVLEQINMERALSHDGISDNGPLYSGGRRSNYLYTTEEEEKMFWNSPEVLEQINFERAFSHDGITYKSEHELASAYDEEKEFKQKKLQSIIDNIFETQKLEYCKAEESAKLLDPNKNIEFSSTFISNAQEGLAGSFYFCGNSGKYGKNGYDLIENCLDSLKNTPGAYNNIIYKMYKKIHNDTDNYNDIDLYRYYYSCIIILSMIIEKNYPLNKQNLDVFIRNHGINLTKSEYKFYEGSFEFFVMEIISNLNSLINKSQLRVENIIPNPVNFVSEVNGSEYIDIRTLGMQLIAAYHTNHRLSDDRNKYKQGKYEYQIPEGVPTLNDISAEIIEKCQYCRIGGRYGHYTEYSEIPYGTTFVVDELTGIISKIVYKQKGEEKIEIESPSMNDIKNYREKRVHR